jgi:hypothetical protein
MTSPCYASLFIFFVCCFSQQLTSLACVDSQEKFRAAGKKFTCRKVNLHFKEMCSRSKVRTMCPQTCEECVPSCVDTTGTFTRKSQTYKCKTVRKNKDEFCSKSFFKKKCPEACDICKSQQPTPPPIISGPGSCEIKANMAFPQAPTQAVHKDR